MEQGCWSPVLVLTDICGFPSSPRRVVIRITPLAPLTPNTAVEAASFRMEKFSISLGSICEKSLSTPSTSTRGREEALERDPIPRIYICAASAPGWPVVWTDATPGTAPARTFVILATGAALSSSVSTIERAPVTVALVCVP